MKKVLCNSKQHPLFHCFNMKLNYIQDVCGIYEYSNPSQGDATEKAPQMFYS